jgi:hypothetical protein
VIERLFLDRVDTKARCTSVASQNNASVLRLPDETKAALAIMQLALARTKIALHTAITKVVPPLPAHDAGREYLALEYTHSPRSHALVISQPPGRLCSAQKNHLKCGEPVARRQVLSENRRVI